MISWLQSRLDLLLSTASDEHQRPDLSSSRETNLPGVFAMGDLAGAPVIKLAMEQGVQIIEHIAKQPDAKATAPGMLDVLVVGAGAAGVNAALAAHDHGLTCAVIEKEQIANTIENFPEGKPGAVKLPMAPPPLPLDSRPHTPSRLAGGTHGALPTDRFEVRP